MPAGRPMTLDDAKKAQICAMLALGCSRATAASYVGCCVKTIRNAAAADPQFQEQVEQSEAQAIKNAIENVQAGAKKSWRAAAWLLQTLKPRRYHCTARVKKPRPKPSPEDYSMAEARRRFAARSLESSAKTVAKQPSAMNENGNNYS